MALSSQPRLHSNIRFNPGVAGPYPQQGSDSQMRNLGRDDRIARHGTETAQYAFGHLDGAASVGLNAGGRLCCMCCESLGKLSCKNWCFLILGVMIFLMSFSVHQQASTFVFVLWLLFLVGCGGAVFFACKKCKATGNGPGQEPGPAAQVPGAVDATEAEPAPHEPDDVEVKRSLSGDLSSAGQAACPAEQVPGARAFASPELQRAPHQCDDAEVQGSSSGDVPVAQLVEL